MHGTPTQPEAMASADVRRFGPVAPDKVANREAYIWLSRGLEEAIVRFIGQATDSRYALRAAFYEFNYDPVLTALKVA
jgi:hypothetical protein